MLLVVVAFVVGVGLALLRVRAHRRRRPLAPPGAVVEGLPSRLRDPETGELL